MKGHQMVHAKYIIAALFLGESLFGMGYGSTVQQQISPLKNKKLATYISTVLRESHNIPDAKIVIEPITDPNQFLAFQDTELLLHPDHDQNRFRLQRSFQAEELFKESDELTDTQKWLIKRDLAYVHFKDSNRVYAIGSPIIYGLAQLGTLAGCMATVATAQNPYNASVFAPVFLVITGIHAQIDCKVRDGYLKKAARQASNGLTPDQMGQIMQQYQKTFPHDNSCSIGYQPRKVTVQTIKEIISKKTNPDNELNPFA